MNSQPDADEVKFARSLVNPEKPVRDKTLASLRKYVASIASFEDIEMLKLWKALYYCMWLSDKQPIQAELAQSLTDLIDVFSTQQLSLLYLRMFFRILLREWFHLDQYRVNKFYSLTRLMFRKALTMACEAGWQSDFASVIITIINDEALLKKPNGIRFHLADIFLPELVNITNGRMSTKDFMTVLKPFTDGLLRLEDNSVYIDRVYKEVMNKFVSDFAAENGAEMVTDDSAEKKLFADVNTKVLQKLIFDTAADENTPNPCRKKLYDLHKVIALKTKANFVSETIEELLAAEGTTKGAPKSAKKDKAAKSVTKEVKDVKEVEKKTEKGVEASKPAPVATEADKSSKKKNKRSLSEASEEEAPKAVTPAVVKTKAVETPAAEAPVSTKKAKITKTDAVPAVEPTTPAAASKETTEKKTDKKSDKKADKAEKKAETPAAPVAPAASDAVVPAAPAAEASAPPPQFIESKKFAGRKVGYAFKKVRHVLCANFAEIVYFATFCLIFYIF